MNKTLRVGPAQSIQAAKTGRKILFANVPADGHFNPLTSLAVYLKSIGYDVRWYSSLQYADKISKLKVRYYPFKKALEVTGDNVDSLFPDRAKHKSQVAKLSFDLVNFFIRRAPEYYEDIAEIRQSFPFDLMICDVAFSAIPLVKEKLKVPVLSIGVFPLAETSRDLAPNGLGITPSNSWLGRIKQAVLRFIANKFLFGRPTRIMKNMLAEYGVDAGNSTVFDVLYRKSTLMLQSGTAGFEYTRSDLNKNVRFIGPLLPYSPANGKSSWFNDKLTQYSKIILVTQGTVEKDHEKILVPTLEAFKNTDCLVVATTGGSKTQELRERYPFDNVIIEDFIPFGDIMPYADVYITNGGYGGVMLAIENQLPMVMAGVHEGKNEINARLGYFKLGINLGTENPKASQVKTAVEKVLSDETYSTNVKKLSREFRQFNPQEITAYYVAEALGDNEADTSSHKTSANYPQRMVIY